MDLVSAVAGITVRLPALPPHSDADAGAGAVGASPLIVFCILLSKTMGAIGLFCAIAAIIDVIDIVNTSASLFTARAIGRARACVSAEAISP